MARGRVRILVPVGQETSGRFGVGEAYTRSVRLAGGEPYLFPGPVEDRAEAEAALDGFGGLLVTGGVDLDPSYFGEAPHAALGTVEPARDRLEWALLEAALARRVPILGICRGCQMLAARVGGTLYQDLAAQFPGAMQHAQKAPREHESHAVSLEEGTRGRAVFGDRAEVRVNSFHHQAVRTLPEGFRPFAWAPDGVLEGFEGTGDAFTLAVQWHPEGLVDADPAQRLLFSAFVQAAGRFAEEGRVAR